MRWGQGRHSGDSSEDHVQYFFFLFSCVDIDSFISYILLSTFLPTALQESLPTDNCTRLEWQCEFRHCGITELISSAVPRTRPIDARRPVQWPKLLRCPASITSVRIASICLLLSNTGVGLHCWRTGSDEKMRDTIRWNTRPERNRCKIISYLFPSWIDSYLGDLANRNGAHDLEQFGHDMRTFF